MAAPFQGLVLSPGLDLNPEYGRCSAVGFEGWRETPRRDQFEIELVTQFRRLGRPVLGICRGAQVINAALGGSLIDDLGQGRVSQGGLCHRDPELYDRNRHLVAIQPGSLLASLTTLSECSVVSVHHQAVAEVGEGLTVSARAPDGVIEAVESADGGFVIGVQWHPEWMPDEQAGQGLISQFVAAASRQGTSDRKRLRRAKVISTRRTATTV